MRTEILVLTAVFVAAAAGSARAQNDTELTPMQVAVACAPRPSFDGPGDGAPRILGGQDTVMKSLFGTREQVVVGGGTATGLQLGQQFFIRRDNTYPTAAQSFGRSITTVGWLRIVAVNASTAIGNIERACSGIVAGDFLEPFTAPEVPPAAASGERTGGEPDFASLSRIVIASENHTSAAPGDFVLIDRGGEQGLTPGVQFSIYRDMRTTGMPLASIGEGVVISTGESYALTRITRARDAVITGDYVAIRKP